MSNNPEDIRRNIEATRRELSQDVDALNEKVSPARVVGRRVERTKGAMASGKAMIMGVASSTGDTAAAAPGAMRDETQGNPLAVGLIAFGAGWLASSFLPATQKEQQAAVAVKDKASEHSEAVTQPLSEAAHGMKDNLRGPASDAAESVRSTATEGASNVKGEARSATEDVSGQAQHAKEEVASRHM